MRVKLIVLVLALLAVCALFFLFLLATDTALSVWARLRAVPVWLQAAYATFLLISIAMVAAVLWWWWRPLKKPVAESAAQPLDDHALYQQIETAAAQGVDVNAALAELQKARREKTGGVIYLAVYGEISSGKSSVVKALVPQAEISSDVLGGTTREAVKHRWHAPSGDQIVLIDLPGFGDHDQALLDIAGEEARRAHLVIFINDGDFTASQEQAFQYLHSLQKPMVIALNKADQFDLSERTQIKQQITTVSGLPAEDIVWIRAGGKQEVIRILADGEESREIQQREIDVQALRLAVQRQLDKNLTLIESLRESAVLLLAQEKLLAARDAHREAEAEQLVKRYSKRAVIGALAAITPGSDLVIQGVLATKLINELCRLYEVKVKEVQVDEFLKLAGGKIRNATAITLAIAGNGLKAFPGLGTVSGGLVHAVAYGMIFDSLGRAAAETLASRGELRPYPAAQTFEALLNENLHRNAGTFAKLALDATRDKRQRD